MFIQTEDTPNPEVLKFLPGQTVLSSGTASYAQGDACADSPLAQKLLSVGGVQSVFFAQDFIAVTKTPTSEWLTLKVSIFDDIMTHFVAGLPVITEQKKSPDGGASVPSDPIEQQIQELLDTRIRPAVAQDGGDIIFHSFKGGVVYLTLQGACSGCPSASITLKNGVENLLKYYIPEVTEVQSIEETSD